MANGFVVIGVDPASTKLAMVALSSTGEFVSMYNPKLGKSGGQSCSNAMKATRDFVLAVSAQIGRPDSAFVEAPIVGRGGVRTTMVQCFTSGAIQGVLHDEGIPTQIANVSSWKKRVVGKGNATKEEVAKHLRLRWPDLFGSAKGNQDLIDASCIAIYGQSLIHGRLV